ncbi:translation initiation factor IF-2 [Candidatus Sneabacter namystus]|uniref:Translation initiation factor IF-2 n=1 Tax=Candidatus Sneabacter namystus TaxID=2601646 RepID=A0A5C0UI36_9RICK|nr:translation initiation factor IF-2 [Candidatus Sneabacter namystus]QEK39865.1 translation initiation factor IF-2 [Candidatus Sneabacter namystus]
MDVMEKKDKEKKRLTLSIGKVNVDEKAIKEKFLSNADKNSISVDVKVNKVTSYSVSSISGLSKKEEVVANMADKAKEIQKVKNEAEIEKGNDAKNVDSVFDVAQEDDLRNKEVSDSAESRKKTNTVKARTNNENEEEKKVKHEKSLILSKDKANKRLHKANLFNLSEGIDTVTTTRSLSSIKRAFNKSKKRRNEIKSKVYRDVVIGSSILVSDLAHALSEKVQDVLKSLKSLGVTHGDVVDGDTAEMVAVSLGHAVKRVASDANMGLYSIMSNINDSDKHLEWRPPVVSVMGHVDHGKTSLLDALRKTSVADSEEGGITQYLSAYVIGEGKKAIVVIDTPGHEAFSQMRRRGASVTDIAVIVIAADDGIKDQTVEAIKYAKASCAAVIIAINKIDKPDLKIEAIKADLLNYDVVPEEMGGDVVIVPVSAKKGTNLDELLKSIVLVADILSLKANYKGITAGAVLESKMDAKIGVSVTVVVQRGVLRVGDIVVAGSSWGKIRRLSNFLGNKIDSAGPSTPVEVIGLGSVPKAGDIFMVVEDEKKARALATVEEGLQTKKQEEEDVFDITTSKLNRLSIVVKADVQGALDAILNNLPTETFEGVALHVLYSGLGDIQEADVNLAHSFSSMPIVLAFNVKVSNTVEKIAKLQGVHIGHYSVIYKLLEDVRCMLNDMLPLIHKEYPIGSAIVKKVFCASKIGKIAGCLIVDGIAKVGCVAKIVRNKKEYNSTVIKSIKREKMPVKEVKKGIECGLEFNIDTFREEDVIEFYEIKQEKQQLF